MVIFSQEAVYGILSEFTRELYTEDQALFSLKSMKVLFVASL